MVESQGLTTHVVHRSDDLNAVRAWVLSGLGLAIVAGHIVPGGDADGVVELALAEPLPPRVSVLLWPAERPPHGAALWFRDAARAFRTA